MFAPESFNVQKLFFGCKFALKPTDVNLGEVLPKTEGAKVKVFQTCFTNKFGGNEKIIENPNRSRQIQTSTQVAWGRKAGQMAGKATTEPKRW